MIRFTLVIAIAAMAATGVQAQIQGTAPVDFNIETSTGSDTLYLGVPSSIIFNINSHGNQVAGLVFPLEFVYSGPNLLGVLTFSNIVTDPVAREIFEYGGVNLNHWDGSGTDSLLWARIDGGQDAWTDSGQIWRINFVADSLGSFHIDSILMPPANVWTANTPANGEGEYAFEIINYGREYVVVIHNGDVNADGVITASDLIYLINYVFKTGPSPKPCEAVGDPDCQGDVDAADVIMMVNYIFKSLGPPCPIEMLIPETWTCP